MKTLLIVSALSTLSVVSSAYATRIGVFDGGSQNTSTQNYYAKEAKAANATSVRLMLNLSAYSNNLWYSWGLTHGVIPQIKAYKAAGISHITLSVSSNTCDSGCAARPNSGQFKTLMQQLVKDMGSTLQQVDAVEILNEWETGRYGPKYSTQDYIDLFLKDAYTVLKAAKPGIKIIAGSVVMNHESYMTDLFSKGKQYIDGFAYHPYGGNLADFVKFLDRAKAVTTATGKPMYLTEWGCPDWSSSAACLSNMSSYIDDYIDAIAARGIEEADFTLLADQPNLQYKSVALLTGYNSASQGAFTESKVFTAFKSTAAKYLGSTQAPADSTPTASADPVLKGSSFRVVSGLKTSDAYGECLNVSGGVKAAGTPVVLYPCSKTAATNELFQWSSANALSVFGKFCVVTNSGGTLVLATCTGTAAQAWKYLSSAQTLGFSNTGKVLDISGSKVNVGKSTALGLYNSNGETNQKFSGPSAN